MHYSKIVAVGLLILNLNLILFSKDSVAQRQLTFARVDSLTDCLKYLVQFGYLKDLKEVVSLLTPSFSPNLLDPKNPGASALKLALSKFQQYTKLPITGEFDENTKAKMNTPRCGNKDILQIGNPINPGNLLRKKRYVTSGFKWQKRELTYRVSRFSESGFSQTITLREVDRAFEVWGNVTDLSFIRSDYTTNVDIDLRFARSAHGDIEPFDGRGITLAHAFPPGPEIGGDIHFDDDEDWTSENYKGTNFFHVVVHELGHALGLRHSDVEEAIMFAFARSYEPTFELHEDDIEGIRALYGHRRSPSPSEGSHTSSTPSTTSTTLSTTTTTNSTTTKRPENDSKPDLCQDSSSIDAITSLANGQIYAFKGAYAFRIDPNGGGILSRYTEKISYVFHGLPSHINSAVLYEGKSYFFKGKYYWRYENRKIDGEFPRLISKDFPGIPDDLDAAFTWSGDNQMYFFKGDKYWSFNPLEKPPVAKNYPLPISQWYGLPSKDLDSAFQSPNGPTYFFKDQEYWLFDDENFQVAESDPPYPRSTRVMWLGCTPYRPNKEELQRGWIRIVVDKLTGAVQGVKSHIDYKLKKLTGWLG